MTFSVLLSISPNIVIMSSMRLTTARMVWQMMKTTVTVTNMKAIVISLLL